CDNLSITFIDNSEFQGFRVNSLLFIRSFSKLKITNSSIEDIYIRGYGALFSTYTTTGAIYEIKNVNIKNIRADGEKGGALLVWQESHSLFKIEKMVYSYGDENAEISITNSKFNNIKLKGYIISYLKGKDFTTTDLEFNDCQSNNGIIGIMGKSTNKKFVNITINNFNENNASLGSIILDSGHDGNSSNTNIPMTNITITNSNFYTLLSASYSGQEPANAMYEMKNIIAVNNKVYGSFFHLANYNKFRFNITNSQFISNNGINHYGTILYNDGYVIDEQLSNKYIMFKNCVIFRAITNSNFIYYINCTFYNNTASTGTIGHSKERSFEPQFIPDIFSDKNNLLINDSSRRVFVTNPTKSNCTYDMPDVFYSGNEIKSITCKLYDDYEYEYKLNEVDDLNLDELIFFEISTYDPVILKGRTKFYCTSEGCSIQNISVIGHEGEYELFFNIVTN
ncbi:hypothetical protein PIROE2DRAFT_5883, partial [Piromyces sp. E2]